MTAPGVRGVVADGERLGMTVAEMRAEAEAMDPVVCAEAEAAYEALGVTVDRLTSALEGAKAEDAQRDLPKVFLEGIVRDLQKVELVMSNIPIVGAAGVTEIELRTFTGGMRSLAVRAATAASVIARYLDAHRRSRKAAEIVARDGGVPDA